ncbi:hypothetical protein BD770DRAFT_421413 [Pilaira anomala]|nr:hypothetical protein BD770DRAFT_421413 [Pilaira anomala]
MEKYSRWRDAGTGIQPFLPPVPPRTDSSILVTLSNVLHIVIGPIQAIIKIILISLLGLLYILFVQVLGSLLTPIAPLKRMWTSLFSKVLLRLVLFLAGFFHIKTETVSIRKSRGSTGRVESNRVKKGDVIVTNWTSYIDVLYLASKYNPVFTQVYIESDKVKMISLWEAIRLVGKIPESKPNDQDQVYTVKELSIKAKESGWGPIVVFAEGATTNGRALLKFAHVFKDYSMDDKEASFQIMAFNDSPCSGQQDGSEDPVGDSLIAAVGNISKLRKTNLSMADKRDFLSYYESRNAHKKNK